MNKIFLTIASFVCLVVFSANAQTYQRTDRGIKSIIDSMKVEIQFYNPSTVRVLKSPEGKNFNKKSFSVIEPPQETDFTINQKGDELYLKSKNVQVDLNMKDGKISFSTSKGETLLNEKVNGVAFTNFNDAGVKLTAYCSHMFWIKMKQSMDWDSSNKVK